MNVHDSSGNHRDIQACLPDNSRDFRQVLFHALRLNVASFSHRQIDTIKPQFGGGLSHLLPVEPLQVFGEINDRHSTERIIWHGVARPTLGRLTMTPAPATLLRKCRRDELTSSSIAISPQFNREIG